RCESVPTVPGRNRSVAKTSRRFREGIAALRKRPDGSGKESQRCENVPTVPGRNRSVAKTSRRFREGIAVLRKRPDGSGKESPSLFFNFDFFGMAE
ncbi:MAG: hypothetical protein LBP64_05255, partial [Tannerella sp.]|nr:hypothetical protein [Tannerella sp.]